MKKNILIFAGNDFIAHQFLNGFIPRAIKKGINPIIIRVKNSPHHFNHKEMKRYAFYEDTLLVDHLLPFIEDNPSPIFKLLSFEQLTARYNLNVIECDKVNSPDFIDQINSLDFIGALSIRCFQIFKQPIIKTIRAKGFFCNSHPGILPDYRGVYCLLRGMVGQEKQVGWNLHEIEEGIDTGKIIKTATITNDGKSNMLQLFTAAMPHLVDAWSEYVEEKLENKDTKSLPQTSDGNYYTYPTPEEMNEWLSTGKLKPLNAKDLVRYYCDLFYADKDKHSQTAQGFKVHLINKVAQFETMLEMYQHTNAPVTPYKKAA